MPASFTTSPLSTNGLILDPFEMGLFRAISQPASDNTLGFAPVTSAVQTSATPMVMLARSTIAGFHAMTPGDGQYFKLENPLCCRGVCPIGQWQGE